MEGLNPDDTSDFRKAALKLQRALLGERPTPSTSEREETRQALQLARPPAPELEVVINAPLDFELQSLDYSHPYLRDRGFSDQTIETFGLGFCSRGMMTGRVVIPLKDPAGRLIGYGGRLVDDSAVTDECPKYLFPGPREKGGKRYEFHKSEFLYQGYYVFQDAPLTALIIVEGFPSVWWLNQSGLPNVVATMGSSLSEAQAHFVIEHMAKGGLVYAMTDGDKAGARLATEIFEKIGPFVPVRWLQMGAGKQPTDHDPAALRQMLAS
jgi:DNA primase